SISGQLGELEKSLGVELLRRVGRGLELTVAGQRILSYAEEIFALGDELLDVVRDQSAVRSLPFTVGIADVVPKSLAYLLVEPALRLEEQVRLICREGRLTSLLADLAVHRLDLVIADRPMPANLNVRGYSHWLGESDVSVFGTEALVNTLSGAFPARLDGAPLLLPGEDAAIRPRLEQWLADQRLHPRIVGEFDDSALANAFGQAGAGLFVAPTALAAHICEQHRVSVVGRIETLSEQLYAITTERRLTHPAIVAISQAARDEIFAVPAGELPDESGAAGRLAATAPRPSRRRTLPNVAKKGTS
ncbi:MAG TPA: LysR substrate-binding domain-containing protein, partial [Accumulibacter sp.]|nr:LysR substrate-binding domain-containing protein [Accumulibacter sp.]